ncbi:hypothetical protein SKAU_G00107090 [Synaphobranchus kaupii]|uniref:Uncharacterized protein n=1 Tax=Synaphobranchus kaupii TaxID=118154 RepID=A0A9Q1J800_SYNKA|nr:hypothetical protein SKAU_G00107090 [Synaphobranchus kaupii]
MRLSRDECLHWARGEGRRVSGERGATIAGKGTHPTRRGTFAIAQLHLAGCLTGQGGERRMRAALKIVARCALPLAFKGAWPTAFKTTFEININLTFVKAAEGANQKRARACRGGFRERGGRTSLPASLRTELGRLVLDRCSASHKVMSCSNLQALRVFEQAAEEHTGMTEGLWAALAGALALLHITGLISVPGYQPANLGPMTDVCPSMWDGCLSCGNEL